MCVYLFNITHLSLRRQLTLLSMFLTVGSLGNLLQYFPAVSNREDKAGACVILHADMTIAPITVHFKRIVSAFKRIVYIQTRVAFTTFNFAFVYFLVQLKGQVDLRRYHFVAIRFCSSFSCVASSQEPFLLHIGLYSFVVQSFVPCMSRCVVTVSP